MASVAKTVVATGVSSGLGFEAIKQLLEQTQPYKVILGARNTQRTQAAFDALTYDRDANSLTVLPCELNDLKDVRSFAQLSLNKLGHGKLDYLLLNAGIAAPANKGPHGSKWCETLVVNHYSQFYLTHLLRGKLESSKSRIAFVSSGGIRQVSDAAVLEDQLKAGAGGDPMPVYSASKFVQLLGAHWWRRQLTGVCTVVAVSPGLIPGTGLGGGLINIPSNIPDAKPVAEGGSNILRALFRDDLPEDPDQIFLTSWGEWWPSDVYGLSLDKALQDKWSPSQEELEKQEGITA